MRKETYDCLTRAYHKEISRERTGLHYFEDTDILFYWKEVLRGINLLKHKKVVNLTEMRRLSIGLVAVEMTVRERMGDGI